MQCVLVIIGFAVFLVVAGIWSVFSTRRLAFSRSGENFDTFRASFPDEPEDVLRAVYERVQVLYEFAIDNFPVRGTDQLELFVGTREPDGTETVVLDVLKTCGRQLPAQTHGHLGWGIGSVSDFVDFVADCPPASSDLSPSSHPRHNDGE